MRLHRRYSTSILLILLSVSSILWLEFKAESASVPFSPLGYADRAQDLLNELTEFEVLGSVYDFDGRVRTTIAVDPYPIVFYPYQVDIYRPYYASTKAHGIKYMTYGALQFVETNYTVFCNYYGFDPDQFANNITGVNLEGICFKYSQPGVNGWPTMGFISRSPWREVLFNVTKLAVEAGVDMIVFDGGWGSYSGAISNQLDYDNLGWYCFDNETLAGFNQYLSSKYNSAELAEKFNITDISTFNFAQYLKDKGYRTSKLLHNKADSSNLERVMYENQQYSPKYPPPDNYTMYLWREFENYQLKTLIDFYKNLSSELKAYAQSRDGNFWIAANLKPTLSYHEVEGRLSIIPFLTHIDFPFFEVWYDDIEYPKRNVAPLFRTIYAAGKHFASMTCPTPSFSSMFESDNPYPEEQVLATAELIATGGWPQTTIGHNITYIRFIQQHPELLPKQQDGEIGLIYSVPSAQNFRANYRMEEYGYKPFESIFYLLSDMNNVTFDIVIFGDNEFYPYTPTLERLSKYKALILTNATCLSDGQVNLLFNYVSQGGVLIGVGKIGIYDENGFPVTTPERLDFANYFNATGEPGDPESIKVYHYGNGKIVSLSQNVMSTYVWKHELIMRYGSIWHRPGYSEEDNEAEWWSEYEWYVGEWINWFASALSQAGVQTGISTDLNPMVMNIRYWNPETNVTIFHFINYLYDNTFTDTAVDQVNANFTFALRPELQGKPLRITYYAPDEYPEGLTLDYTAESDGRVRVTIPYLHIWGILKVEEEKPQPSTYQIERSVEWTGSYILDGDVLVSSNLTLKNAVIKTRSFSGAPVKIEVSSGGSLNILNTVIEPYDEESRYYIVVHENGNLRIENSTIREAGLWGPLDYGGVWVESEDTVVLNSKFENCYQYGLFLMEANYTYIRNCAFTGCTEGLMAYWTRLVKIINCTFTGNSIGLYVKHMHYMKVSNCIFEGNTWFGAIVDRSEFTVLEDSEFTSSEWDGLSFWASIFVEVVNCTSHNNGYGYAFRNTPISTVLGSDAYNNLHSGILLRDVNSWGMMPPSALLGCGSITPTVQFGYPANNLPRGDLLPSNVFGGWNGRRTLIVYNKIWNNSEGISVSCSGYFNEEILILNNTIQANGVGVNVNYTSSSIVAGNNFINNTVQVKAFNIDIYFNATNYGNYWSDYAGSGAYEVCDGICDYQPLAEPSIISDVLDTTPPNVLILAWNWVDGWDEDGINDYPDITIRIWDDFPLYVNPQYEIGIVNLVYPALYSLTPEEPGNPFMSYAIGPPEFSDELNNVTIGFTTDFYGYWIPDYLNESTLRDARFEVYASDIYGHWSRNETEPPHITLIGYEAESFHVEVSVFDQSNIANVTLHYSTDGQTYKNISMTYNEAYETYECTVQGINSGTVRFYISATDVYQNYAQTSIYTLGETVEVLVSVEASWNELTEQLTLTVTAECSLCGSITSGEVTYGVYTTSGAPTGLEGSMIYNFSSAKWEAVLNTKTLPINEYKVIVNVTDSLGHSGKGETTFIVQDTLGPIASELNITPNPTNKNPTLTVNITDINLKSNIMAAEFFIDQIRENGAGTPLNPADGNFDSPSEHIEGIIDISELRDSVHTIYVHGMDEHGNWGEFSQQTFIVDKTAPLVGEPIQTPPPDNVQPFVNVTISVNVTDLESGVKNVTLYYSVNGGEFTAKPMQLNTTTGLYEATIDGYEAETTITYMIVAYDNAGNKAQQDNAENYFVYTIIPEFPSIPLALLLMLIPLIITFFLKRTKAKTSKS